MEQAAIAKPLFTDSAIKRLMIPLILEQLLAVTVGMADTMMIAKVGEAAVSGVSLVDMINVLIINVFAALATGGAVVAAQMIGAKERNRACGAAKHLYIVVFVFSIVVMFFALGLREQMLRLFFGDIADDVMGHAMIYFWISALSYPFLAVYNAGAALFRAQGNGRISMYIGLMINILNIAGNALFIFGFGWGVAGAALSSLLARAAAAVVVTGFLLKKDNMVSLSGGDKFRLDGGIVGRILNIGVPNGLENCLFYLGRILVVGVIATFGTTQIAANAVANNFDALGILPGHAFSLAMITIVGQCVGAQEYEQAKFYIKKLLKMTYIVLLAVVLVIFITLPLTLRIYDLSPETMKLAAILIGIHNGCAIFIWPLSFVLPSALRASNDVRFTMVVSIFSMWMFRIVFSYIWGKWFGLGAIGVWIAMIMDWVFRSALFIWRYRSGKWMRKKAAIPTGV